MPPTAHPIAERLERAARARWFDGIRAKCRGNSVSELLQRAAEDLAARLELSAQTQESKTVVARHVESRDDLVEQHVELTTRIARKAAEPSIEGPGGAVIHGRTTLPRARPLRRVGDARSGRQGANPEGPRRSPSSRPCGRGEPPRRSRSAC